MQRWMGGVGGRWMACVLSAAACAACGDDAGPGPSDAAVAVDAGGTGAPTLADPVHITTTDGELRGDVVGDAVRFLKVPYAKPPVGELRWKAPLPNEPWSGVRHEQDYASPCPQSPSQQTDGSKDEDCLYLNLWRPNDTRTGLPVMLWIHGGGFTTGSAADFIPTVRDVRWYDGRFFAERHGVIVVSVNYRLGVFGFFAHPDLPAEGSPLGNQGLLDQRRALEWVKEHITSFGGDPDNVTIFGQSAGAGSVCMQMVSPGSQGLFHRAIGQSGACGGLSGTPADEVAQGLRDFAAEHGCEGDDALGCLREQPASEFISDEPIIRTGGFDELRRNFNFGPVIDGAGGFLPEPSAERIAEGKLAKVPYILGTTFEEAQLYYLTAPVPETEEAYVAELEATYGAQAARVLELYPSSRFGGDYRKAMTRIATDGSVCGIREHARACVRAGLPVYLYDFNIVWNIASRYLGPAHSAEISHVFGAPFMETPENIEVADVMNELWATFAKTGDPNYDGAPVQWPRLRDEAGGDRRIQFAPGLPIVEDFRKQECDFWRDSEGGTRAP